MLRFGANTSDRARIDSDGRVLIGDTDVDNSWSGGDSVVIGNTSSGTRTGVTLVSANDQDGGIYFSDGTSSGSANVQGQIVYNHSNSYLSLYTTATERFRIDSSGHILNLNDSSRLKLGAGQDFEFYHDGTNSGIHNNTGDFYIENDSSSTSEKIYIRAKAGENGITLNPNGSVELYYDGASDSSLYSRYDGVTIRNNDSTGAKDCNIDMIGRVDGNVQLHFYADNNSDNNKKFRVMADSGGESFKLQSYYTGGWEYHLSCTRGSNNTSNRRIHAGDGGIRFDNTCHDYRDIDGDGHLFRRDGQAQLGVDDFFYLHDISTSDTNNRIRHKFDTNAGSLAMEGGLSQNQSLDYAEFFEWSDGNPNNEDRIGHLSLIHISEPTRPY